MPGQTLEIRGGWTSCTVGGDCDAAMQLVAERAGARIIYRTITGSVTKYPREGF